MIKKTELLRRLQNAENEIKELRSRSNTNYERADYILHFLADKLGYEIKLKDVIKVSCDRNPFGEKYIATEVEMVEKPKDIVSSLTYTGTIPFTDGCCEPKPKRKYTKRKKK